MGNLLSRVFFWLGVPLGCLLLVLLFSLALFPYDRFRDVAIHQLGAATGAHVELAELDGGLSIGGPAVTARGMRLSWPDGSELDIERGTVRPAWSLSWITGRPAVALDFRGEVGRIRGTVWPGAETAFDGELEEVAVDRLPLGEVLGFVPMTGLADAEVDLRTEGGRPVGSVDLDAREGALTLPNLPVAIPFDQLDAEIRFAADGALDLQALTMQGPMLDLDVTGGLGASPDLSRAPLDFEVSLAVVDENLRPAVSSWGLRLDREGRATLKVSGTPQNPIVR